MSIPIPVAVDIEQHPTPQMSLDGLSIDTDAGMDEKVDDLHLYDSIERDAVTCTRAPPTGTLPRG